MTEQRGAALEKRFVHGPGIDDYVAMVKPEGLPEAGTYNYHADGLGSVTAMSNNSDATLQASYEYQPFGEAEKMSSNGIEQFNPYGYTGRELDDETGLIFYRSRYFSPEQRRFVGEDKWGGIKDAPSTHILKYVYVANNVINNVDPLGLSVMKLKAYYDNLIIKPWLGVIGGQNRFAFGLTSQGGYTQPIPLKTQANQAGVAPGGIAVGGNMMWGLDECAEKRYGITETNAGLAFGVSGMATVAYGQGDWWGHFNSINIGIGIIAADISWNEDWFSFSIGGGLGFGLTYGDAFYSPFFN